MEFILKENPDNTLSEIVDSYDETEMNWVTEGKKWGEIFLPEGIEGKITREFSSDGNLIETYTFVNKRDRDYFPKTGEIGIAVPFPDNYTDAQICMKERCHAHIWCGGNEAYVMGLRMGGFSPNLGLVLTKGEIREYSIIRNPEKISNDRGTIILHPVLKPLKPKEKAVVAWNLFWFNDRDDFNKKILDEIGRPTVCLKRGIYFDGEETEFYVLTKNKKDCQKEFKVSCERKNILFTKTEKENCVEYAIKSENVCPGEKIFEIEYGESKTYAKILVLPKFETLVKKRCTFIARKQQYNAEGSNLNGAFLIYDNEENKLFYEKKFDHNGGRERVGMGVLIASWLQKHDDEAIESALQKYTEYIKRELFDENTGIVYNDVRRDNEWNRLYNYPWMAVFFMERYKLYGNKEDIGDMYKILMSYYDQNGEKFYAIGIPMTESIELLKKAEMNAEADRLLACYVKHGKNIIKNGLMFPAHEVKYEQSIVAPAVCYLFELYEITGEKEYLENGKKLLDVLILFNGHQPDFRLYENAIRHWDGYWFGKYQNYGDTFPHYWSALSGLAFYEYSKISGDEKFKDAAENSLRGILSCFHEDGSASAAYVYPYSVNNVRCGYEDPWANDQDWGMYFYLQKHN